MSRVWFLSTMDQDMLLEIVSPVLTAFYICYKNVAYLQYGSANDF